MLPDENVLTNVIGSVYDAAMGAVPWGNFLKELGKISGASAAALVMHSWGSESRTIRASWNVEPSADSLYEQYYGSLDLWALRGKSKPAGYVCKSESLCPVSELVTTEIYNDFIVPYDVLHGMFGVAQNNALRWASVSLFSGANS